MDRAEMVQRAAAASIGPGGIEIKPEAGFAAVVGPLQSDRVELKSAAEADTALREMRLQSDRVELKLPNKLLLATARLGFNRTGWN